MAMLHVRNVPDNLYAQLDRLASLENHSLSGEVVRLLSQAVEERRRRADEKRTLANLRRRRFVPRAGAPGSLDLLREDGDARVVAQDIESYEQAQEAKALLKILALGNRQIEEGKVTSAADVFTRLRGRRGTRQM